MPPRRANGNPPRYRTRQAPARKPQPVHNLGTRPTPYPSPCSDQTSDPYADRQHDDQENDGENEQAERQAHFHRKLVGALLRPEDPFFAHLVTVYSQRVTYIAAEFEGLA